MKTVMWFEHLRTWCLAGVLLTLAVGPANAEDVREITWADLVPASTFEDPFEALTSDQLYRLDTIYRTREMIRSDAVDLTDEMMERTEKLEWELNQQEIDVDELLGKVEEIAEQLRLNSFAVVEELDGANIRMPGYVLPLEFDGNKVTEFFLVPYVGACMHAPVPPPNQMVHVSFTPGLETGGLYDPVWISGIMSTEAKTSAFGFSDGDLDLPTSYTMDANEVTSYE
jgi:hypothetical protein